MADEPRPSILLDLATADLVRLYVAADAAPVRVVGGLLPYRLCSELDRRTHAETTAAWAAYHGGVAEPADNGVAGFELVTTRELVRLLWAVQQLDDPRMKDLEDRLRRTVDGRSSTAVSAEQRSLEKALLQVAAETGQPASL